MMSRREQRLILRILRRRWRMVRGILHEFRDRRRRAVAKEMAALERKANMEITESWRAA